MQKIFRLIFLVLMGFGIFSCTQPDISEGVMETQACCGDDEHNPPPPPPPPPGGGNG